MLAACLDLDCRCYAHCLDLDLGFLEASHEHVTLLGKKAAMVEEYLKQR